MLLSVVDSCRSHKEGNKSKIIMFCHHLSVVISACSSVAFPGWNSKRSTAQPSRAGVLRSTTPSTLRQVRACSEQPAQACSCCDVCSSDRTLYHLYRAYQVIQSLRLMRVREHAPPSSAVWTTGETAFIYKVAQHVRLSLSAGTSAQQLDASFSTSASLEFFQLDLTDPSLDMKSCGSFSSSHRYWKLHSCCCRLFFPFSAAAHHKPVHRYHKLVWGPYGMDGGAHPSGVLIAGGENGNVILYDPAKIMAGQSDVIIAESEKHTGPVRALDVNPFQVWSS